MAVAKKAVKKTATKKTVTKRSTVPASAARKARAGGRRIDVHSHVVPAELLQAIERDPARFQMTIEARDGSQKIVREGGHAFPVYPEFSDPAVKVAGMDRKGLDVSFISPAPIVMMYWLGVDAAAEAARITNDGIANMVAAHPKGLDMPLTEAGGGLSGGQRQLLTLARLMLRDPAIVFMDEPTANMDQSTEARVIAVLGQWLKGRTLVLSTHRTQLLEWVDRIAVVDEGQCVMEGPRAEMIDRLSKGVTLGAKTPAAQGGAA
jgi:hypothetical protein